MKTEEPEFIATDAAGVWHKPEPDATLNTVLLTGSLTEEPELRLLRDGGSVCHLRLSVPRMGHHERPGFVDVQAFGVTADACARLLTDGWVVAVAGRLQYGEWEDESGGTRSGHTVIADLVEPLRFGTGARAADLRPAGAFSG